MTKTKLNTKSLVMAGLCVALGVALPQALHLIPGAGSMFSPMHLPVLLCGLLAGPVLGAICGLLTPLLSSLIFSMPPLFVLPGMLVELCLYGLIAGLLYRTFKWNLYLALVVAMLAGRIGYGLLNAALFLAGGSEYSFSIFFTSMFVTGLPAIVSQLILVPLLVLALQKGGAVQKPKA